LVSNRFLIGFLIGHFSYQLERGQEFLIGQGGSFEERGGEKEAKIKDSNQMAAIQQKEI
jgi:hypothetical protein